MNMSKLLQNKRVKTFGWFGLLLGLVAFSCSSRQAPHGPGNTDRPGNRMAMDWGIEAVPASLGRRYRAAFDRYTKVSAPNGKPIHILAQSRISNVQIVRVRGILEHYLSDYPGSLYGSDKSSIADAMADNGAKLLLLNGSDGPDSWNALRGIDGQPLYEEEIQVEGGKWYMEQDYEHRDAAFEEILHLVHDYGIGVDGPHSLPGAAPGFQREIRTAQQNALANKIWAAGEREAEWIDELTAENSLSQEYLASVMDVYYGLWGAWDGRSGMYDVYAAKTRADIRTRDPEGQKLLENKFFHPYLTYNAQIAVEFAGTFSLRFDARMPYTHHSQYLKDITLLGQNNVRVVVNELDNDIRGNAGVNTVVFRGDKAEYSIELDPSGAVIVRDSVAARDGANTLRNIEKLEFRDQSERIP